MKRGAPLAAAEFGPGTVIALTLLVLLGSLYGAPAHAIIPAMPPPCPASFDSEPVATLIERLKKAADQNPEKQWERRNEAHCASESLSRKDERVVPALISLMETRQSEVETEALYAICGRGHSGAEALPYLMKRIRASDDSSFTELSYEALPCMGKRARPAIPLLIEKSLLPGGGVYGDSEAPTKALGYLARYAPDIILPHLVRLLDQPDHIIAAAGALESVGPLAKPVAAEPLRKHLVAAARAKRDVAMAWLTHALQAMNATGPAVATLVEMLQDSTDAKEREGEVAALITLNDPSPAALSALISYTTTDESWSSRYEAASWLAIVKPFPKDLASKVTDAIARLPEDDRITERLEAALEPSGAPAEPRVAKSPPVDLTAQLGRGLMRLTQQPHAVSVSDVASQLGLAPQDYVADEHGWTNTLTAKRDWSRSKTGANPVFFVHVDGVTEHLSRFNNQALLYEQRIMIRLDPGACVSIATLQPPKMDPTPTSGDPQTIEIIGSRPRATGGADYSLKIVADRSADPSEARLNFISTRISCGEFIDIEKWFEDGYWGAVCPFSTDRHFVQTVIIPAIRELLGAEADTYDLDSPQMSEVEKQVIRLGYDSVRPATPDPSWRPVRLWLGMDRCSHKVSVISKVFLEKDP